MGGLGSIIDQCLECCECPAPTLRWETRSATRSKHGFAEWLGFVSSPPKRYLRVDWAGDAITTTHVGAGCTGEEISYFRNSGSGYGQANPDVAGCDGAFVGLVDTICPGDPGSCVDTTYGPALPCGSGSFAYGASPGRARSFIPGGVAISGTVIEGGLTEGCDAGTLESHNTTDDRTVTLSDEYLTADLIANTLADLPEDYPLTTAGSSRNLSTDELSFSVREGRYYWRFPINKVGSGKRYVVRWVERFQPEDTETAPTDTLRCESWDGVVPDGYDAGDPDTWPELGPFDADVPATDGLFNVGQYTDPEDPDTYVAGGYTFACRGTCDA